jgi:hypothetical protein
MMDQDEAFENGTRKGTHKMQMGSQVKGMEHSGLGWLHVALPRNLEWISKNPIVQ